MRLRSKINLYSIFVTDQEKALQFYTGIIGLKKMNDFPAGEFRWLTVSLSGNLPESELLLEPNDHPVARAHQQSNYRQGIPAIRLFTDNLLAEYQRLKSAGVHFTTPPTKLEHGRLIAMFDDTCGNLIQLVQE